MSAFNPGSGIKRGSRKLGVQSPPQVHTATLKPAGATQEHVDDDGDGGIGDDGGGGNSGGSGNDTGSVGEDDDGDDDDDSHDDKVFYSSFWYQTLKQLII